MSAPPLPNEPGPQRRPRAPPGDVPGGVTIIEFLESITPHAWATPTIAALIVVAFGFELWRGASLTAPSGEQLLAAGGDFGPSVADGEWWRTVSSMFVHAGALHIAMNVWAFWNIGRFTERVFGNLPFLAIYFLSGFGGALTSLAVHPLRVSVGASGAVFGVYGALLAFVVLHEGVFPRSFLAMQRNNLLGFIGFNLIFSLTVPNIDISAHGGGLVTGFFAGALLSRDLTQPSRHLVKRALTALALAVLLATTTVPLGQRLNALPEVRANRAAASAFADLKAGEVSRAIAEYTDAIEIEPDAASLSNRGLAYLSSGRFDLALADFRAADALEPTPRTSALTCEASRRAAKDEAALATAERDCSAAIARDHDSADVYAGHASVLLAQDKLDLALDDADHALRLDAGNVLAHLVRLQVLVVHRDAATAEDECETLTERPNPEILELRTCARVAEAAGDVAKERERLDACLAVAPKDPAALLMRAGLNAEEGRDHEASRDYLALVAVAPDAAVAWNNLAWTEVVRGDFASARTHADRSVALEPDVAAYRGTRCFALFGVGDLGAARVDCARATELNPEGLEDRGMLALLENRPADARRAWELASRDPRKERELKPFLAKLPAP